MIVSLSQPVFEQRISRSDSSRPREGTQYSWCCFRFLNFLKLWLVVDLPDLDTAVALIESNLEIALSKWSWEDISDLVLEIFKCDLMESNGSEVECDSWWEEWEEECKADAIEDVVRVKLIDDGTCKEAGVHVREGETNERVDAETSDEVGETVDREGGELEVSKERELWVGENGNVEEIGDLWEVHRGEEDDSDVWEVNSGEEDDSDVWEVHRGEEDDTDVWEVNSGEEVLGDGGIELSDDGGSLDKGDVNVDNGVAMDARVTGGNFEDGRAGGSGRAGRAGKAGGWAVSACVSKKSIIIINLGLVI